MFQGKMKAVTLSYDDGILQDIRLIEMLDKYGLKCTFNLNSERVNERTVPLEQVAEVYKNHEVAGHTLNHYSLKNLNNEEIIRQVEKDRINLESIVGYPVYGFAYPYGSPTADERVLNLMKEQTQIRYARGTDLTYGFELPNDLLHSHPTIHQIQYEKLFELAHEFVTLQPDTPKLFYAYGHSYEFDYEDGKGWEKMEEFCKIISGRDDIFYGTNREVLL